MRARRVAREDRSDDGPATTSNRFKDVTSIPVAGICVDRVRTWACPVVVDVAAAAAAAA